MKSKTIVFAALLIAAVMALLAPRQAKAGVTFSYFYDSLIPYGDWVDVDQYGYCWAPRGMAADWRPYTDGYWTYTDAGWTWVSYEDFGSITYHYGRWVRLEDVGWVWKPDYRWGPAWVSWRQSDNYMGWAPLPPDVAFSEDNGVGVWVDRDYDIGPSSYVFCETRYFGAPVMRNVCVPVRRNVEILDVTVNITNITVINNHDHGRLVYCGGPDYRWLAARSERPINRLELVLRTDGDWMQRRRPELSRSVGVQLFVDAPVIEPPHERFAPPRVAREIRAPRIDRGWGIVADPGMRDRIHQRYQEQTRGLTAQTAPAYRVNEAEVRNFVREPRPAPSAPMGAVQTMQSTIQRAPQQAQQTLQPTVQQVQPAVQPSAQPTQSPRRMRGGAQQPQPVQTQPGMQPAVAPQTTQPVQPSAQPTQSPHRMHGKGQQQPVETQPGMQPVVAPQTTQPVQPSTQPTPSSRRMQSTVQPQTMQTQPAVQPQATQAPQRVQPSVQSVQTPKAAVTPAQAALQTQRTPSEQLQRQAEQQQRQAAESTRNAQRQQQEQLQRQAEQQQRQAAESARNAQRQQQEQQQRQAAESARNAQRQQQEQQQRQAADSARNAQRQQQEQQQRQAAESARNAQRQQQEQLQRRENVAPQAAPQSQPNKDNNKDHKKHERDRLNDPNSVQ